MNEIETKILKSDADWQAVKNVSRNTMGKDMSNVEASSNFKWRLLISEHSPIRLIRVLWRWSNIPSWVATHYVRHHIGVEKWVKSQRTDRTGVPRDELPQNAPVVVDMEANAQALINMARVRLCYHASPETRTCMESLKASIGESEKELATCLVPNCIAKMGCPEPSTCGHLQMFLVWCGAYGVPIDALTDIHTRYLYYKQFCERTK